MSKVSKLKAILIMALSAVMMFSASLFMMNNNAQPVSAEEEAVFEMVTDVQARLDVPAGLRFKATFNDAAKAEIDESVMFGFAIAPKSYFDATNGDYNSLEDGVIAELDKTQLVKVGDKYVISGVLYNIMEQNWDLDFSAVAFYAKEGGEMFFATGELPVGNINDLIIDQYWDGDEEAREQLLNTFNYGGTEDLVIEDNEFVGSYTIPAHPIGISTADQFVSAIAEEGKEFKMVNDVTITNDVLGGSINIGGKLASDFKAVIDGNGKNLTVNAEASGYFTGLFTNFTGTLKNANLILWIKAPLNGTHGLGALTNYFDGVIDGCTINYTFLNGGGSYGYGYASLLGTMGENAILQNTIINAKDVYHEGGIIAEYATDSCSQIINVAVVSNKLHYPTKYLGKLLPHEYVIIDGLYVTDSLDDLVAGKADYVLDIDKYDMYDGESFQYPYGDTGYGTDVFYNDNASITIADILGREVERVSAPVKTSSGGAMMDALAGALNPALVEITMNDELIAITQGDEPVALNVTATYDGVAVDPSLLSWTSSDPSVVSVTAGKITAVGEGQAYVYASYLGVMSAGCLVDAEALWYEITDEASFIEAMQGNFSYRLTQDLVLTDKYIDTTSTYGGSVFTSDFYGTLDGAGHTVTFNADTTGQTYFNGAFRFIYGAVKNTNFVVNVKTPHSSNSTQRGVFAYRVFGTVENCIINVTSVNASGYGYASTFGELGENAQIKNVVINARNIYMGGGIMAQVAAPTAQIRNVAVLSHQLGWADMYLGNLLPQQRCDIEGVYTFETATANAASSLGKATAGGSSGYDLVLDVEKYKEATVANITWTTSSCTDENLAVLYTNTHNLTVADVVGFAVEAYDAPILTMGTEAPVEATLASLRFATAE